MMWFNGHRATSRFKVAVRKNLHLMLPSVRELLAGLARLFFKDRLARTLWNNRHGLVSVFAALDLRKPHKPRSRLQRRNCNRRKDLQVLVSLVRR
ncbi:MAG: hypothetical protein CMK96_10100 [Pseudomonas sp.]|nr:hypothetical protein [Pseudomonas sp.]